jgi:PPK2 family polyphosphate:nucleotide phosphotransferase
MADRPGPDQTLLRDRLRVRPGASVDLASADAGDTLGWEKDTAGAAIARDLERLTDLQERLWAERKAKVLIVLQGMDCAGKGGTIEHVMGALSPLGCVVHAFKVPTEIERGHDYLWRVHARMPASGEIAIFDRSHYEEVLIVRVEGLVPEDRWRARYDEINAFEALLAAEGTTILKFFLHIDRDEQRERLQDRVDDPDKRWKFRLGDLDIRARWEDYMAAYEDALERCSTASAPWFVVPANRKWFRNLAVARILRESLEALEPRFPDPTEPIPADLVIE